MSEPVQTNKLDLTALGHALNDDADKNSSDLPSESQASRSKTGPIAQEVDPLVAVPSAPLVDGTTGKPDSLASHSKTLAQPPSDETETTEPSSRTPGNAPERVGSPATLSPSSERSRSPVSAPSAQASTELQSQVQARTAATQTPAHPVQQLKAMFPDYDNDTLAAVLASSGGSQEAAVNALLQMADPSFKPPSAGTTQTDSDALLAQTLAMEEERNHRDQLLRQQQPQQPAARSGGGASSFFSEIGSLISGGSSNGGHSQQQQQQQQQKPTTPAYDANNLTYQPRVRRPMASPGARASYAAPPATGRDSEQSSVPAMPGPGEAKMWQEELNRMAETGLARAASTFSSLKQRANAALASSQTPAPGQAATAAEHAQNGGSTAGGAGSFWRGQSTGRGGGGASHYFQGFSSAFSSGTAANHQTANNAQRQSTQAHRSTSSEEKSVWGFASPKSPQLGDYDRDPSPVGDNELAKILARGRGSSGSTGTTTRSEANKGRSALADRYGLGQSSSSSSSSTTGKAGKQGGTDDAEDFQGWESAGRTPIRITDNSARSGGSAGAASGGAAPPPKVKDSIALMDSAQGRGVMSPTRSTPQSEARGSAGAGAGAGAGTVAAAGAGLGVGAGVGATSLAAGGGEKEDEDGSDSDDLEYVSNPFEDED